MPPFLAASYRLPGSGFISYTCNFVFKKRTLLSDRNEMGSNGLSEDNHAAKRYGKTYGEAFRGASGKM